MKITVKSWWYMQEQNKAQKYNFTLLWKRAKPLTIFDETKKEEVESYHLLGEKIKETEKAIYFNLYYYNLNKAGRYVTDAPVEKKWKAWIPKSVII